MEAGRTPAGLRVWLLAGAGGAVTIALLASLFRSPVVTVPPRAQTVAAVGLARIDAPGNSLLKEEAMLRDPTPLFLPTRWSASESVESQQEARGALASSFPDYPTKLVFAEAELNLRMAPPVAVPKRPADAFVTDKPARPFLGFGETDRAVASLAARGAFLKVVAEADGRVALAEPLAAAKPPTTEAWEPMEFLVAIDPAGVVSPPVLTESSQVAAVDDYFQAFLTQNLHIGDRLAPGFYRVSIGP